MKKIFLTFIVLFYSCAQIFAYTKINILKVYDGDTILAQIDDNIFRIRLIDIDCFEGTPSERAKWQAKNLNMDLNKLVEGGNLAGEILREKLKNKNVTFDFQGIDKYNRALGILYVDKTNINKEMIKTGYCVPYKN